MPSKRTSYKDATESHLCRCYRVSRSYLHLNRGLTSPLATAMNFIPVSYFWSPLWRLPPFTPVIPFSLLSIISVTRHLGAVFQTFAPSFCAEEKGRWVFDGLPPLRKFRPLLLAVSSSQTRISQTPPGP